MAEIATLEERIKGLKKTLVEKQKKEAGPSGPIELRPFRKRLKRLQRRRRVLIAGSQRGKKAPSEKETKPAGKPAEAKPETPAA